MVDGVTADRVTGTIGDELIGVNPLLRAGIADVTFAGVIAGLNDGVFVKVPDGWLDEDAWWIGSINDNEEWATGVVELNSYDDDPEKRFCWTTDGWVGDSES